VAKAIRANPLWKVLDHGTEITNSEAPTPKNSVVPNEPGANVCQTYAARKTTPSTGRNPSSRDLKLSVLCGLSVFSLTFNPIPNRQNAARTHDSRSWTRRQY
jgi:hypothetical protein